MITKTTFYDLLTNLSASFVFLFLVLIFFKPKIIISPYICKGKYLGADQTDYYFIKIINISIFSAYDVSIELLEVDSYPMPNGQMNKRFRPLSLILHKVSHIAGYRPSWIRKNAPYALRIRTSENLEKILNDDYKAVMIKVSSRHGLTGLVKIHSKEYVDITQLKKGKFSYGLKFG